MSTMDDEPKYKWLPVIFFILTGVTLGVSLYLVTASAMDSEARAHAGNKGMVTAPPAAVDGAKPSQVVLRKDVRTRFDKVDVVYRGIENGSLRLDVFIRELDPDYPYRREIERRKASEGFRLGGVRFELISAGRNTAKLLWIRGG
ncbi:MAG: hypothetical protein PVF97_00890 [Desulfobacterales bacterium]|jgi:hypothetical protein